MAEKHQAEALGPALDAKTVTTANPSLSATTANTPSDNTYSNTSNNTSSTTSNTKSTDKTNGEQPEDESTLKKEPQNENSAGTQLTEEDLKEVKELKSRDQEVRTHEAAHLAAAGKYATGGASFDYKRGPDGKNYAVGGEVGIDTSAIPGDPQATLQKAQQIRAAAQAPANPSSQDRQVAASASQMEAKARQEIAEQRIEKPSEENNKVITDSEKTGSDESENNAIKNKAASAYQAIDSISQPESSTTPLIQLIA
ncbi:MAG: putative metalloprotease CJM1_0395 family protein [Gammaproteobacteria bacterium]|nr:putative metalloprotease CJM1_0395 family protein [Gammaproteobacteria bacterium]